MGKMGLTNRGRTTAHNTTAPSTTINTEYTEYITMVTSAAIPAVISPKWPLEMPSIEVGRWTPGGIYRTTRRKTCGRDTTTGATAQNILADTAKPG